jgi:hypothetical protein
LDRPIIQAVAEILSPYSNLGETTMLSILTEKVLIVNSESRCQNAGHEPASYRQHKCEDACPSPSLEIAKIAKPTGSKERSRGIWTNLFGGSKKNSEENSEK